MSPFRIIDKWIMAFFTKISHDFQRLTGRTNFFLAKISLILVLAGWILDSANAIRPFLHQKSSWLTILLFPLMLIFSIETIKKLDLADKTLSEEKIDFEFGWDGIFWRLVWLAIALFSIPQMIHLSHFRFAIVEIFVYAGSVPFFCYSCFVAVDPLPACKGKIKEFLESFSFKLELVKNEN